MLPNAAKNTISLLSGKGTPLTHIHSRCPPGLLGPSLQSCSPDEMASSTSWCMGLFHPRCRTLHFSWLNFMRLLLAHFSILSRSRWTAAWCISRSPQFCVLCKIDSIPSSRPLWKMSNRAGPSIDPWCTLLVTGFQLDYYPLGIAIQSFFDPHHCLLIQFTLLYEDFMGTI